MYIVGSAFEMSCLIRKSQMRGLRAQAMGHCRASPSARGGSPGVGGEGPGALGLAGGAGRGRTPRACGRAPRAEHGPAPRRFPDPGSGSAGRATAGWLLIRNLDRPAGRACGRLLYKAPRPGSACARPRHACGSYRACACACEGRVRSRGGGSWPGRRGE